MLVEHHCVGRLKRFATSVHCIRFFYNEWMLIGTFQQMHYGINSGTKRDNEIGNVRLCNNILLTIIRWNTSQLGKHWKSARFASSMVATVDTLEHISAWFHRSSDRALVALKCERLPKVSFHPFWANSIYQCRLKHCKSLSAYGSAVWPIGPPNLWVMQVSAIFCCCYRYVIRWKRPVHILILCLIKRIWLEAYCFLPLIKNRFGSRFWFGPTFYIKVRLEKRGINTP